MRNSSSLDWLRFMHTPNDYRVSLGACGLAPVVMIGEKVYGRLQPIDVKKIIEELE